MVYLPISKTTSEVPLKNVFDTLNNISKSSLQKDAHEVNKDDKPMEEVQVDPSAIGNVSSGSKETGLKACNIFSSHENASNVNTFNMNDDASKRQHTGPIILHVSTPIFNSNTGYMEADLQGRHSFNDNTSVDVGNSNFSLGDVHESVKVVNGGKQHASITHLNAQVEIDLIARTDWNSENLDVIGACLKRANGLYSSSSRGIGNLETQNFLFSLCRSHHPSFLCIAEPMVVLEFYWPSGCIG
ncbi:hypothetical protein QYF36_001872 [Acer negundo]|nr:hypothetical protein QYF36_001872 [Acer negundo]